MSLCPRCGRTDAISTRVEKKQGPLIVLAFLFSLAALVISSLHFWPAKPFEGHIRELVSQARCGKLASGRVACLVVWDGEPPGQTK